MSTSVATRRSASAIHEEYGLAMQQWTASRFHDEGVARAGVRALREWLGWYPNQAADVIHLSLSAAFTAQQGNAHEMAQEFASLAVEGSAFAPLATPDEYMAAALAALIAAESGLESGTISASDAASLEFARACMERVEVGSALNAWARSRRERVDAAFAEAVLERRQAAQHYLTARDMTEPLVRNARLRGDLTRDCLRIVYGNAQRLIGQEEAGTRLIKKLVCNHFVHCAVGAARTVSAEVAAAVATHAADACAEFGVPGDVTAVQLHAALERVPEHERVGKLDRLVAAIEGGSDIHSKAILAALLSMRGTCDASETASHDHAKAGEVAAVAGDAYAWTTITADLIADCVRKGRALPEKLPGMFWVVFGSADEGARNKWHHASFRAHFERTLGWITADSLERYTSSRILEISAQLSMCLEASRAPNVDFLPSSKTSTELHRARLAASDWLGRLVCAVTLHPRTLILIPVSIGDTTTLLCLSDATNGVTVHPTSEPFQRAAIALTSAMQQHFTRKGSKPNFEEPGRKAHDALPEGVRALIRAAQTILVAPELSATQAAVPYELFADKTGFLGLSRVIARLPSLRALVSVLEPAVLPARRTERAVCVSAPNTIPAQPLKYAAPEVAGVRSCLARKHWNAPTFEESQLLPDLLLGGLELASVVHVAAHGVAVGGSHAVLLPRGERFAVDAVTSYRGQLAAAVYLSACSIGASEYLGGGVSRGFADALVAKGAPAILASQWPLQDAAASRFAATFYREALKTTVGEALRIARRREARTISPALWGSLILIGSPWHRIGKSEASDADEVTTLLQKVTDPSASKKARMEAVRAARAALKRRPDHRRLEAAIIWATEAEVLFAGKSARKRATLTSEWASEMAGLARDVTHAAGEALCRAAQTDLLTAEDQSAAARIALDRAIDLSESVARSDNRWNHRLDALLTHRQKMDLEFEVPEVRLPSGMVVNDRSDPAVRFLLDIQHAVDQQATRRGGTLRLRLPDRTLDDLCWNAVVLGQRQRFSDEFACAGFARQLTARAVAAKLLEPGRGTDARRVAGGVLRFLWNAQRMTHLQRELATGQAKTLRVALEALGRADIAGDADTASRLRHLTELCDQLPTPASTSSENRFTRARERLRRTATGPTAGLIGQAIRELIDAAPSASRIRAHRSVWCRGLLLEIAFDLMVKGNEGLAGSILAEHASLESTSEADLMAYLFEGFEDVRRAPLDPLIGWRHPASISAQ